MSNVIAPSHREWLDAYVCGLRSTLRNKRFFAMLTAHFDDSGSDPKSKHRGPEFVLAGYVSTIERWKQFSDEWATALDSGQKHLDYFHSSEAESLKEQFLGWNIQNRDTKLEELANITVRHAMFGVAAVLNWEAWIAVRSQFEAFSLTPYALLFTIIIGKTVEHPIRRDLNEKVKFIFDRQGRDGFLASEGYRLSLPQLPPEIRDCVAGIPSFERDIDVLPLQAADFAAWQVRRRYDELDRDASSEDPPPPRQALMSLDQIQCARHEVTEETLNAFLGYIRNNS